MDRIAHVVRRRVPPSASMERCVRQPICARRVLAPGMIEFAVTPYGAISVATASVNALMPGLGGDVVRLAGAAVEQEPGRGVDQPAVGRAVLLRLRAPVAARGRRHDERAAQVHADHVVPFVVAEVEDHARAAEARVVDDDVEPAPRVERALHELVGNARVGDVAALRDGLAARGARSRRRRRPRDPRRSRCRRWRRRRRSRRPRAPYAASRIAYGAADAASRAGHDGDTSRRSITAGILEY